MSGKMQCVFLMLQQVGYERLKNVIREGREGTSIAFKINTDKEFDPCTYYAAANTVVTSFTDYTCFGVERIWHKHRGKHKVLFEKQRLLIDFLILTTISVSKYCGYAKQKLKCAQNFLILPIRKILTKK